MVRRLQTGKRLRPERAVPLHGCAASRYRKTQRRRIAKPGEKPFARLSLFGIFSFRHFEGTADYILGFRASPLMIIDLTKVRVNPQTSSCVSGWTTLSFESLAIERERHSCRFSSTPQS